MGGGEAAFAWLYELAGSESAAGLLASLAYRVISWLLALVGYLVYLSMGPKVVLARADAQAEERLPA
jgi:hypothetical protein